MKNGEMERSHGKGLPANNSVKGQHRPERRTREASACVLIKPELTVITGKSAHV